MPAPFNTTNPADFTALEGLYIFEQNPPGFVRGVSLNTVGVYGTAVRGPVDKPISITSESRFLEVFGGGRHAGVAGGAIASELWKALLNKPFGPLQVVRVAAAAAVAASFNQEDTDGGGGAEIIKIEASSVGVWGNDVGFRVEDATDGDVNRFNLVVRYDGETVTYENLDTSTGNDNLLSVIGDDDGNLVVVSKLADGRPLNTDDHTGAYLSALDTGAVGGFMLLGTVVASFTSVAGDDGTVAATDYTGTGRALDKLKALQGVGIVFCANEDGAITATVNTATLTAAAASTDRMFCIHEGALTGAPVVPATVATDAASFRSDRIIYCHNAPSTLDPDTGTLVQTAPNSWMASILSQTDVDIHPGEEATKRFTAGIASLDEESLTRADYIALKDAGVASLEKDPSGGFLFVSGVTTDLTPGKTEITRRRSADFLQISVANRIRHFVKKKNTAEIRSAIGSEISAFLRNLQLQNRVVELFEVDQASQNTASTRAQGLEFVLMRVRLIGHMLFIVLKTEIGTGVTIEVEA